MRFFLTLIILLLHSGSVFAQLDSLIFYKEFNGNYSRNVYGIEDQNNDGFNDILIYDCTERSLKVYFGGAPMDTSYDIRLLIPNLLTIMDIAKIDIIGDSISDIVVSFLDSSMASYVTVFEGGIGLDANIDMKFSGPAGGKFFGGYLYVTDDFDGNGEPELVVYDTNPPFIKDQLGIFYFYNIGEVFDTLDYKVLTFNPEDSLRIDKFDTGDLDGDGLADISLYYYHSKRPYQPTYRSYIKGNADWNFEPINVYQGGEHDFNIEYHKIIKDINEDGSDDILMLSYGNVYPYYYDSSILYGELPVDTIQDIGLNTQNLGINQRKTISPGDVNGDGFNDLLCQVKAFGATYVRLWLGGQNMPIRSKKSWKNRPAPFEMYLGEIITSVGDIDGDGVDDICFGEASPGGSCGEARVYIYKGDTSIVGDTTTSVTQFLQTANMFYLGDAYPNPFNPATTISYSLKEQTNVKLAVYTMLGQEVAVLVNSEQSAGQHKVSLDASKLATGVYIYRLETPYFTSARKMILVK